MAYITFPQKFYNPPLEDPSQALVMSIMLVDWSLPARNVQRKTLSNTFEVGLGPTLPNVIGCWRLSKILLGWKTDHFIIMKPTNSPTQGQPNPEKKNGSKAAFAPRFLPTANIFFAGLGLVLCRKQTTRHLTPPTSPRTPECVYLP